MSNHVGVLTIQVLEADDLADVQLIGTQDPYVSLEIPHTHIRKTPVIENGGKTPNWSKLEPSLVTFQWTLEGKEMEMRIKVVDAKRTSDRDIGVIVLPIEELVTKYLGNKWIRLKKPGFLGEKEKGLLRLKVDFVGRDAQGKAINSIGTVKSTFKGQPETHQTSMADNSSSSAMAALPSQSASGPSSSSSSSSSTGLAQTPAFAQNAQPVNSGNNNMAVDSKSASTDNNNKKRRYMENVNLLKNADASEEMTGWSFDNRGSGWNVETAQPHFLGSSQGDSCKAFVSSFDWCTKSQVVDLVNDGKVDPSILDGSQNRPSCTVTEYAFARPDCGAEYKLRVTVLDSKQNQMFDQIEHLANVPQDRWTPTTIKISPLPQGARYVQVTSSGKDSKFWNGHFGAKITGASLILHD